MPHSPPKRPCLAFSTRYSGRPRALFTPIEVVVPSGLPNAGKRIKVQGLWDTGATQSAITDNVANQLQLPVISKARVSHAGGESVQNIHPAEFTLPNRLTIQGLRVTCAEISGADVLVGMDVITAGDFALTSQGGEFMLSYHFPTREKMIDFVPMAETANQRLKARMANSQAKSSRGKVSAHARMTRSQKKKRKKR